jgi:hypothetical protein
MAVEPPGLHLAIDGASWDCLGDTARFFNGDAKSIWSPVVAATSSNSASRLAGFFLGVTHNDCDSDKFESGCGCE